MAGLSFTKYVKRVCGLLVIMPILALTGCGQGDGPVSIPNTAIPPLDPPPVGFCDPITFEVVCPNRIASLAEFEGGPITILANPQVDANNDSATVARMQKFRAESGATFGGGTLNLTIPFEVASGEVFTMNVWSPRPVPMRFEAGIAAADVNHGGTGWEVLTLDLGGAAGRVSSISIKFDDGTNGDAGIDPDNWTFYFDDIALVTPSDPVVPIDPEVSLYDPPEAPNLDAEVTGFDSQSVINDMFADDSTYSPVLAVSSGVGYDANVAQIGFIGFAAGFASDYESLDFKVKGMPNSVIFVKLYDSVDSLRINLTSSAYSGALTNGWYQVSIPISAFNGVSLATGIVFESDNTAPMQFTMLLNDIGFAEGDDDGGGTGTGGSVVPDATILEADGSTADLTAVFTGNESGTGTEIVADDSTYAQALEVTVANGYDINLNLAQLFITELSSLDSYDEFAFKVKGLTDNNLVMKIEPPAGGTAVAIDLSDPGAGITVEALSDGWTQVVVSLAQFGDLSSANLVILQTLDNAYALGDTFLLTDIGFNTPGGGGDTGTGGSVVPDATILEADGSTADLTAVFTGNESGTGTEIVADDSTYAQALEVTVANGYDINLNLAQLFITGLSSLDSYDEFAFKVKGLTDNNLVMKIEPPAGGTAVAIDLSDPGAGITVEELSDGWTQVVVSLAQFGDLSSANLVILQTLDNAYALGDTFLLTDIGFNTAGGGSNGGGDSDPTFVNGDFENGLTGWTQTRDPDGVGTISADTSEQGGRAGAVARLVTDATATQFSNVVISQEGLGAGTVAPGDSIDVSFDLYGSVAGAGGVVFVEVIFLNGDGVDVGGRNFVADASLPSPDTPYAPTGAWTSYSGTVIAGTGWVGGPYDVSGGVVLSLKAACGAIDGCGVDVSFDNVTFVIN